LVKFNLSDCNTIEPLRKETDFGEIRIEEIEVQETKRAAEIQLLVELEPNEEEPLPIIQRRIEDFLDATFHGFGPSDEIRRHELSNLEYDIVNRDELEKGGYGYPTIFSSKHKVTYIFSEENIGILISNMSHLSQKDSWLELAYYFYRNSLASDNEYISFLQSWIAFEIIVKHYQPRKEDKKAIKEFAHRNLTREYIKHFTELLTKPELHCERVETNSNGSKSYKNPRFLLQCLRTEWDEHSLADVLLKLNLRNYWDNANYSEKLKTSLERSTRDFRDIFSNMLLCFYVIRNKITHGDQSFFEEVPQRRMGAIRQFFRITTWHILKWVISEELNL